MTGVWKSEQEEINKQDCEWLVNRIHVARELIYRPVFLATLLGFGFLYHHIKCWQKQLC